LSTVIVIWIVLLILVAATLYAGPKTVPHDVSPPAPGD